MIDKKSLISAIYSQKVVVIGDLLLDEYIYGRTTRISREAPVIVVKYDKTEQFLGGAGNAIKNAVAWQGTIIPIGFVGNDDIGETVKTKLQNLGVDTKYIITAEGRGTPLKTRILAGGTGVVAQQVFRLDKENNNPYPHLLQKQASEYLHEILETVKPDLIVVSDYGLQTLTGTLSWELCNTYIHKRFPIVVDSRFNLQDFREVLAITPNVEEAAAIYGRRPEAFWEIKEMGETLVRQLKVKHALLTRGHKGMTLFSEKTGNDSPVFSTPADNRFIPTDITGAGDTATIAFARSLITGIDPQDAMMIANTAAAISVSQKGTGTTDLKEVLDYVEGKNV